MAYIYDYPRPAVTTDALVFLKENGGLKLLLIQRKNDPFRGKWAFPGGFVEEDETLETCVCRELSEETGLENVELKQFKAYSNVDRDPRHRTITIAFYAVLDTNDQQLCAGDDAGAASWFSINELPPLAFDHEQILSEFLKEVLIE